MAHIFNGDFRRLESEDRRKTLPPNKILKELNIKKGETIIDFGCGIGYFSIPVLDFVGSKGKVIAIDISDEMINELKKRTKGIQNLEIIKSDNIKGFKADIILLVTLLHEVDNPKEFLNDCFNALNSNGKVVVIDWQKKETKMGPPVSHRIAKEEVIEMSKREYLEHDIDESLYFLEFKL